MSTPDANGSSSQPPTAEPLLSHQISSVTPDTPGKEEPVPVANGNVVKQFLVGNLDFVYLLMPISVFAKNRIGHSHMRFRRDFEFIPLLLNIILGLQHACVALGHIVAVPLALDAVFARFDGFRLVGEYGQYATHAAVIIAGIGSVLQCIELKIPNTPYQIGTGMASLLGNSHIMLLIFSNRLQSLTQEDGESAHDAYGKVLGTAAVCSLFLIALSLVPRKYIKVAFPPVVTSTIIILVGFDVLRSSLMYWGGGEVCHENRFLPCVMNGDVTHLPFGSPEYLGLGLFVFVLFLVFDLFGTGLSRHIIVLLVTVIVYAFSAIVKKDGKHYVTGDEIEYADKISFLWTDTYKLGFDKNSILPLLGGYLMIYFQATGILTASLHEAQLNITGTDEDQRIQGGLITTGIVSLFAVLATGLPVAPIPQTNSVTYITRIASRFSGISAAIWLVVLGIFGKVMAVVFSEIPIVVRGGIFTIVCATVVLTGLKILYHLQWDRRTSVIVLFSLSFGMANILIPHFIDDALWPKDDDNSDFLNSFRTMVIILIQTPYFMGGLTSMLLHLVLPKDMELGFPDALPGQNE